jgi:hypothetical protein
VSRLVKVTQFAITLKTSVARSKEKITMTAYSRTRKKINQWEQQFGEETGLDVAENRREFWRWLEANGYETYGLLDQPRAEAEEAKVSTPD